MPQISSIYPIVEGHGEIEAIPVLLRRVASEFGQHNLTVMQPYRLAKSAMLYNQDKLEAAIRLGEGRLLESGTNGGIVVCLDLNGDDLYEMQDRICPKLQGIDAGIRSYQVIAVREYEAWFLAAAESFRDHSRCRLDAHFDEDPEAIRGAKQRFQQVVLRDGEYYSETVDQARFTARMDLTMARRSPSFDRFMNEMRIWFESDE